MRSDLTLAAAALLALALSGTTLVRAETESEKLLNEATAAESQDPTQVDEEKAIEKKDGMDAPAAAAPRAPSTTPKRTGTQSTPPAAGAAAPK